MINEQYRWRARVVALIALAVTVWGASRGHAALRGPHVGLALVLTLAWIGALFVSHSEPWNRIAAIIGLAVSALATLLDPGLSTLLVISVGWTGAHISWRNMRTVGTATILFAFLVDLVASNHVTSWSGFVALVHNPQFFSVVLNLVFLFGVVLLLGRFATDNLRVRMEQAKALAELQQAHAELQRRHATVEELATLRERVRLSRELHDTLGHALSGITVQLEAVRRLLNREPDRADDLLREAQEEARAAMRDLRLYLSQLRAPGVPGDLAQALRSMAQAMAAESGWTLEADLEAAQLPENARAALYQVAREALTNCQHHAAAHRVWLRLAPQGVKAVLSIRYDGQGFDATSIAQGHFGIAGMRERLAELGGELTIEGGLGQGTSVVGMLPLPQSGS